MSKPPCKGCEFRRPATPTERGCHSDCEIYAEWKAELTERKEKAIKDKQATALLIDAVTKANRLKHVRR